MLRVSIRCVLLAVLAVLVIGLAGRGSFAQSCNLDPNHNFCGDAANPRACTRAELESFCREDAANRQAQQAAERAERDARRQAEREAREFAAQVAREKAAERKAASERAAAEKKAASERAAAEKKAASERAAAAKKAANERAAAEKKAASERAAAEKKAASEPAAAEALRRAKEGEAKKQLDSAAASGEAAKKQLPPAGQGLLPPSGKAPADVKKRELDTALEKAAAEARRPFDDKGTRVKGATVSVPSPGSGGRPISDNVREKLEADKRWVDLQARRTKLDTETRRLNRDVKKLQDEHDKAPDQQTKGEIAVQIVNKKRARDNKKQELAVVDVKANDLIDEIKWSVSVVDQPPGAGGASPRAVPPPSAEAAHPKFSEPPFPLVDAEPQPPDPKKVKADWAFLELAAKAYDMRTMPGQSPFAGNQDWRMLEIADARAVPEMRAALKATGFNAYIYVNEKTKTLVVAVQGSRFIGLDSVSHPDTRKDLVQDWWVNDIRRALITGETPPQFQMARQYVEAIKRAYGDKYTIVCAGHSLGGGACAYAGGMEGVRAVVLNPISSSAPALPKYAHLIDNYVVQNELAITAYGRAGRKLTGHHYRINNYRDGQSHSPSDALADHSAEVALNNLGRQVGIERIK